MLRMASHSSPFLKPMESPINDLMTARIVDILVPVALDQAYSYRVPAGLTLNPGDGVSGPLGARECIGGVGGEGNPRPGLHNPLKEIGGKLDVPPLKEELRGFVDWVSNY